MDKISIHVNLVNYIGKLQLSLQHSIDLVSFGLVVAESGTKEKLFLPGAYFQIAPAENRAMDFDNARLEFLSWIVACGLRDCIESVGAFLEETRSVCAAWSFAGRSVIKGREYNKRMVEESKKFHKLGLPDKMKFLEEHYNLAMPLELADYILSINRARNCLVHRRGIVSEQDLNSSDGLLVQWLKLEMVIEGVQGKRIVIPPADIDAEEAVSFQQAKAMKLFKFGEPIIFSAQEFSELCWTFLIFSQQLNTKIEKYGREKGIVFVDKKTETTDANK